MVKAYSVVFIRQDKGQDINVNRFEPVGVFFENQILSIVEDNLSKLELGQGIEIKRGEFVLDPPSVEGLR